MPHPVYLPVHCVALTILAVVCNLLSTLIRREVERLYTSVTQPNIGRGSTPMPHCANNNSLDVTRYFTSLVIILLTTRRREEFCKNFTFPDGITFLFHE